MPELPDVTIYIEALEARILGSTLEKLEIAGPFLLRTAEPLASDAVGRKVKKLRRVGKRIAIGFENDIWFVLHLMIAGRLRWSDQYKKPDGRRTLAAWKFESGSLTLTEAGTRKRAALFVVQTEAAVNALDPGGADVFQLTLDEFAFALRHENHTLKRVLTDPHVFSGIGNAYSDEILHRARLSPVVLTAKITEEEIERLFQATRDSLTHWTDLLRNQYGSKFPEKVTAFRPEMAVHGRYNLPCPVCGSRVQRIRYASNETNYCPQCQTGGRLLADRGLSRLLKQDWPRTEEEWEALRTRSKQ